MPEADEFDVETYEEYLQAEVLLPQGDNLVAGTVVGRKRDNQGNPVLFWTQGYVKFNSQMVMS